MTEKSSAGNNLLKDYLKRCEMNSFKLGLCSVTFRKLSAAKVVEIAKKAGVGYIEWGGDIHVTNREEARLVKSICDNEDIKICSYGSYYRVGSADKRKWEEICQIAKAMNAPSVRVWLGEKDSGETTQEEYNRILEDLKSMCSVARKYNLLVCPECHDNTYNNNTDAFLNICSELKADNFRTYFQSRYFRFDYDIDRIERTFDYIENVHVSYRDLAKEQRFRKKDKHYLDKLLQKLLKMNFNGIVLLEFTKGSKEKSFLKDIRKIRNIKI